jgi:hypothetical protein
VNLLYALVLLVVAVAPLAVLGAWFAGRRDPRAGSLVQVGGAEGWWRQTLPWPHGVQEDDEVHWNFGPAEPPNGGRSEAFSVDPVRLRPGVSRCRPRA